ncbi:MAG: hypothetical protein E7097_12685 [Bacteroides sp.]|nr:hypothetical protein [Bacteroides sp.]
MMKKNSKVAVLAAFAFITGLNVYKAQADVKLSDAQLKNVEALASGEYHGSLVQWTPSGWLCYNSIYDNLGEDFFTCSDCSDCSVVSATSVNGSGYCWRSDN